MGDCAGQCADTFESIAAEILSAMILGGSLADEGSMNKGVTAGFVAFPLAVGSPPYRVPYLSIRSTVWTCWCRPWA